MSIHLENIVVLSISLWVFTVSDELIISIKL